MGIKDDQVWDENVHHLSVSHRKGKGSENYLEYCWSTFLIGLKDSQSHNDNDDDDDDDDDSYNSTYSCLC